MTEFLKWIFRRNYQTKDSTDVSSKKKTNSINFEWYVSKNKKINKYKKAHDSRKNSRVVASVNRFVLTDNHNESAEVASFDGLVLTDPKRISWKQKDAFVYTVQSQKLQNTKSELEFVIYIPIDTAVHWLDTGDLDKGERGGYDQGENEGDGEDDTDNSLLKSVVYGNDGDGQNKSRKGGGLDGDDGTGWSKINSELGKDGGDDSGKLKGKPGKESSKKGRSSQGSEASKKGRSSQDSKASKKGKRLSQDKDKDGARNKGGGTSDNDDGRSSGKYDNAKKNDGSLRLNFKHGLKGKSDNGSRKKGEKSSRDDSYENGFKNDPDAVEKGENGSRRSKDDGDLTKGKPGGKRKKRETSSVDSDDRLKKKKKKEETPSDKEENEDEDAIERKRKKSERRQQLQNMMDDNHSELSYGPFEVYLKRPAHHHHGDKMP